MKIRPTSELCTDSRIHWIGPTPVGQDNPMAVAVWWEPGNATRYNLTLTAIQGRSVVAWTNAVGHGRCMAIPYSAMDPGYVAEKMGTNDADAEAITAFLDLALVDE